MMGLAWLRGARGAATLVGDRAELCLPGAIAAFAFLGWLPLIVAVAPLPRTSDLVFLGAGLVSSSIFPLNVLLIAAATSVVLLAACGAAAFGEAVVQRGLADEPRSDPLREASASIYAVVLVAALPVGFAIVALAIGLAGIAPDQLTTPDISGSLAERVLADLAPYLVAVVAVLLLGQALGAAATRHVTGEGRLRLGAGLRAAMADILRRPARRVGIALTIAVADLLALTLTVFVMRTLWVPIGRDLAAGRLTSPTTTVLLVGFVAIWLGSVLAWGALHAWGTAWWSLELAPTDEARRA